MWPPSQLACQTATMCTNRNSHFFFIVYYHFGKCKCLSMCACVGVREHLRYYCFYWFQCWRAFCAPLKRSFLLLLFKYFTYCLVVCFIIFSPFRWALFDVVEHILGSRLRWSCCCIVSLLNGIGALIWTHTKNTIEWIIAYIGSSNTCTMLVNCHSVVDHRSISIPFEFCWQSKRYFCVNVCACVFLQRFIHKRSTNIYLWLS